MCNCIDELIDITNTEPIYINTELDISYTISKNLLHPKLMKRFKIAVVKRNPMSRTKTQTPIANFCPMCGQKYEDQ